MRRTLFLAVSLLAFASPAMALKITNLDKVPHKVVLDSRGGSVSVDIAPDATEYLVGQPGGFLSLATAQKPKKLNGTIHSDGLLSGIIGGERTSGIPADDEYNYVIWPGGVLNIQSRTRSPHRL